LVPTTIRHGITQRAKRKIDDSEYLGELGGGKLEMREARGKEKKAKPRASAPNPRMERKKRKNTMKKATAMKEKHPLETSNPWTKAV